MISKTKQPEKKIPREETMENYLIMKKHSTRKINDLIAMKPRLGSNWFLVQEQMFFSDMINDWADDLLSIPKVKKLNVNQPWWESDEV